MYYGTTVCWKVWLKKHFPDNTSCPQRSLLRLRHLPSLSCQTHIIHMTNTSPSLFITLFLYQPKKFSASGKRKTILRQCRDFTEMCHFPFSLSNSISCHLHKNAWMVSQLLHKDAAEYIGWVLSVDYVCCVVHVCVCPLLHIYVCWHVSEQMRDLLMQIYLSHRECLRKLACMVHVCHTCIVNM